VALLVPQTGSSVVSGNGDTGVHLRYAAVSVTDGVRDSLILPHVNGACMQLFIDEVCARHPDEAS
jgi:hypothetical protein